MKRSLGFSLLAAVGAVVTVAIGFDSPSGAGQTARRGYATSRRARRGTHRQVARARLTLAPSGLAVALGAAVTWTGQVFLSHVGQPVLLEQSTAGGRTLIDQSALDSGVAYSF